MILPISNRDNFIKSFLNPISRLAPNCTLTVDEKISTVVHNNSNIFLKADYELTWDDHSSEFLLCLPDTIKLIKILSCLDEEDINLKYENNCITYNSGTGSKFKYHLFDDSLSLKSPFDFNKIKEIDQWSEFSLTRERNNSILKALPFVTENSKIYLSNENNSVFAELTDKKLQNVDSYTALIADEFQGDDLDYELILDVELFRLISTLSFESATVYINNEYKMLMIQLIINESKLTFVSTSYKN